MPDAKVSQEEVSRILRDWSDIRLLEALVVLAAGFALAIAIKWILPKLAERLPDRFRLWVLPWEPILRVVVLLLMFAYIVPLFIHPGPARTVR